MLADFGGGEFLAMTIPTLVPLVFLLSLACPCLCNDDIKEEQARLKAEQEIRLAEELRLNVESGGFCGAGVER